MSVFSMRDFDEHEEVVFLRDPESGLRAVVAIHSTAPYGMAGGGCRMWPYGSDDEAVCDALRLSRAMSYKLALCDLPVGGAKAVVIGDPKREKSPALLRALGRAIERLGGRYVVAPDVGTDRADMAIIGRETKYVMGKDVDASPMTACGAFLGIRAAVERRFARSDLRGLRVAVQGLGNIGRRLCERLAGAGAELTVADLDEGAVRKVAGALGARIVSPEVILSQEVDVLAPCALGAVLDDQSVAALRCPVVAGPANNQLAEERHADLLAARDILFVPDFVLNAGGVIGASQHGGAQDDEAAMLSRAQRIADIVVEVFDEADRSGVTPEAAAVALAKAKLAARRPARIEA